MSPPETTRAPVEPSLRTPRQRQLVAAASRLFSDHGYRAVSLGDVCGQLGLSGPAFYRHFRSKDELLVAVLDDSISSHLEQVRDLTSRGDDPEQALRAIVDHHAAFVADQAGNIRTWRTDSTSLPPADLSRLRYLMRLYTREWVRVLQACRPELDADGALLRCHAAIALLQSPTESSTTVPAPERRRVLSEMALAALHA